MTRAYPVTCSSCGARVTLFEDGERVGTSAFAPAPPEVDEDDTLPRVLRLVDGTTPPCPACAAPALHRDPGTTDLCLSDDPIVLPDSGQRRRRADQLRP